MRVALALILGGLLSACSDPSTNPNANQPGSESEPAMEKPPVELNLSREALQDDVTVEVGEAPELLPDLFDGAIEKRRVRTSGRVLTDKEAETLEDSVQGVELSIEVETR